MAQRVYGLALGYEDLNDHEELRKDALLAVLVEKSDPVGEVLAGKLEQAALWPSNSCLAPFTCSSVSTCCGIPWPV